MVDGGRSFGKQSAAGVRALVSPVLVYHRSPSPTIKHTHAQTQEVDAWRGRRRAALALQHWRGGFLAWRRRRREAEACADAYAQGARIWGRWRRALARARGRRQWEALRDDMCV